MLISKISNRTVCGIFISPWENLNSKWITKLYGITDPTRFEFGISSIFRDNKVLNPLRSLYGFPKSEITGHTGVNTISKWLRSISSWVLVDSWLSEDKRQA